MNGRKPDGAKIRTVIEECKADRRRRRNMLLRSVYRSGILQASCTLMAKLPKQQTAPEEALCAGAFGNRLNTDFPEDETVLIRELSMFI
ncbi:MAG: hypothetical protein ACLURV_10760 [Gallintestinimicrobium sp.]